MIVQVAEDPFQLPAGMLPAVVVEDSRAAVLNVTKSASTMFESPRGLGDAVAPRPKMTAYDLVNRQRSQTQLRYTPYGTLEDPWKGAGALPLGKL